jgi:putative endonuclease
MNARQNLGRRAEQAAAEHFERAGWRVLGRNVRIGRGEIDIIMRRGSTLVFAEVKARATTVCGSPEDAVDARKRRQVARLAELWLTVHPRALEHIEDVRFDVVAVDASSVPLHIRHLPAAFTRDI